MILGAVLVRARKMPDNKLKIEYLKNSSLWKTQSMADWAGLQIKTNQSVNSHGMSTYLTTPTTKTESRKDTDFKSLKKSFF